MELWLESISRGDDGHVVVRYRGEGPVQVDLAIVTDTTMLPPGADGRVAWRWWMGELSLGVWLLVTTEEAEVWLSAVERTTRLRLALLGMLVDALIEWAEADVSDRRADSWEAGFDWCGAVVPCGGATDGGSVVSLFPPGDPCPQCGRVSA